MPSPVRLVAYNFLAGGSARRGGHWSRLARALRPDVVFGQECRRPESSHGESFKLGAGDDLIWRGAGGGRWGSALLVRGGLVDPMEVPQFEGWVVGGELLRPAWASSSVCLFSVHVPGGPRGYVRTLHEILDRLARIKRDRPVILGGDFNVTIGYRAGASGDASVRRRNELLDRLRGDLGVVSCWQAAHPRRPLAQTLRWSRNPVTPYHCDGIFVPESLRARIASCRVVEGSRWRRMSDHNPVFAQLAGA